MNNSLNLEDHMTQGQVTGDSRGQGCWNRNGWGNRVRTKKGVDDGDNPSDIVDFRLPGCIGWEDRGQPPHYRLQKRYMVCRWWVLSRPSLMAVMSEGLGFNLCDTPFLNVCVPNLPQGVEDGECKRWLGWVEGIVLESNRGRLSWGCSEDKG